MEIMNLEEVAGQVTVENSPSPEGVNRNTNNRLDFINAKKKIDILLPIILLTWSTLKR